MRLILLGAPGSGKGTQGHRLAERYGIAHVSSGELLRRHVAEATELGGQVAHHLARGELVPQALLAAVMREAVLEAVASGGYVLDGYPRSLEQAKVGHDFAAPIGITAHAVVHLTVPDEEAVRRLAARGEGRADDADPESVARRLAIYHAETQPLLDYYGGRGLLRTVAADRPVDEVSEALFAVLDPLRTTADDAAVTTHTP